MLKLDCSTCYAFMMVTGEMSIKLYLNFWKWCFINICWISWKSRRKWMLHLLGVIHLVHSVGASHMVVMTEKVTLYIQRGPFCTASYVHEAHTCIFDFLCCFGLYNSNILPHIRSTFVIIVTIKLYKWCLTFLYSSLNQPVFRVKSWLHRSWF